MLASEAMRIGARLTPKAETLFDANGGTCALGAIMIVLAGNWKSRKNVTIGLAFPWMAKMMPCPLCRKVGIVYSILPHLNDSLRACNGGHDLSREAIADYLEGIEVTFGLRPMPSSEKPGIVEELGLVGA